MASLNYAKVYNETLADAFPHVLNFGALYATPNNGRYRFKGGKTIELPVIKTTGRVASSRDTIATPARSYENSWEEKSLKNQRKWSTLVHPQDVDQTDYAATISNITSVFNTQNKFPEMDAYTVSKIYTDWVAQGNSAVSEAITANNVISVFDSMMANMTENRVPTTGRILYVTPTVMNFIKNSSAFSRVLDVKDSASIERNVTMIDGVQIIVVPSNLMKTSYTFTSGWAVASGASQINMLLIHPESVITPVSYQFACLDEPSAITDGKYVYYEESFEDVFILNERQKGINFAVTANS